MPDSESWISPGIAECYYQIFEFVDCSIYCIGVPYVGPMEIRSGHHKNVITEYHRMKTHRLEMPRGLKVKTCILPKQISLCLA